MKYLPKMQQLHVFRQVVRSRSIRGAARVMGQSQPAVSRTLRELEQVLSVQLFCVIARRGHPLEGATSLAKLSRAKWLLPEANIGYYQQLQDELNEFYGQMHEAPIRTDSVICGLNMVLHSDYLTIVARAMSTPLFLQDRLTVLPITTLPSEQYCVIWSQKSDLTATARQFLLVLRQQCQNYPW